MTPMSFSAGLITVWQLEEMTSTGHESKAREMPFNFIEKLTCRPSDAH